MVASYKFNNYIRTPYKIKSPRNMKMKQNHFYLLVILMLGCKQPEQPKQQGLIYLNDFETIKGWDPVNLSKWPVHSGMFSNKLDSIHPYGLGFALPFKEISPRKLKTVKVTEWVYLSDKGEVSLAMEIKTFDNKSLIWNGIDVDEQISEIGKWRQVSTQFSLRNDSLNKPGNIVNIYTWDKGKKEVYVDDIKIEFIEE